MHGCSCAHGSTDIIVIGLVGHGRTSLIQVQSAALSPEAPTLMILFSIEVMTCMRPDGILHRHEEHVLRTVGRDADVGGTDS